jgi:cell division protein ZapA
MPQVDVSINGRRYSIACDDGEQDHLKQLAQYVDGRVKELVSSVGQVGDQRLLVMTSLLVADELAEAYAKISNGAAEQKDADEDRLAAIIDKMAERVEAIAAVIEAA